MLAGGIQYDMLSLAGIRQLKAGFDLESDSSAAELSFNGILGIVRHPWYLAGFILLWTSDLGTAEIVRNVVLDCYFVIGAILEERKLVAELGDKYREYQRQVPMLFPYKWLMR